MKISKKVNESVTVHAEAEVMTDLFKQLAQLEEVFSINFCFRCKSNKGVKHIVRVIDEVSHYEVQCKNADCKAKFSFGQNKKGGNLFPHYSKNWKTVEELMSEKNNEN